MAMGYALNQTLPGLNVKAAGPLPLSSMIKTLQSSELRKHSLVRLNDLLLT